jgi:hypothetical protein
MLSFPEIVPGKLAVEIHFGPSNMGGKGGVLATALA